MNGIDIIKKLKFGSLSETDSNHCMQFLMDSKNSGEQKSAILSLIESRNPSISEISSSANYILGQCIVPFKYSEKLMDVCGTGGDGNSTINISTLTALILAATGVKICKHGNYGVTSLNGSSGILEHFGYKFKTIGSDLKNELDEHNITFLHAPLFHPILKNISHTRKNMEMKTIFNILGPMVNPLEPYYRFTGVSNLYAARAYNYIYQQKDLKYRIVHSIDGNDEITMTDSFKIYSHSGENYYHPYEYSSIKISLDDLRVTSMQDAANKFMDVLDFKASKKILEAILVNSAFAYQLRNELVDFKTSKAICEDALKSKQVKNIFNRLIQN